MYKKKEIAELLKKYAPTLPEYTVKKVISRCVDDVGYAHIHDYNEYELREFHLNCFHEINQVLPDDHLVEEIQNIPYLSYYPYSDLSIKEHIVYYKTHLKSSTFKLTKNQQELLDKEISNLINTIFFN